MQKFEIGFLDKLRFIDLMACAAGKKKCTPMVPQSARMEVWKYGQCQARDKESTIVRVPFSSVMDGMKVTILFWILSHP